MVWITHINVVLYILLDMVLIAADAGLAIHLVLVDMHFCLEELFDLASRRVELQPSIHEEEGQHDSWTNGWVWLSGLIPLLVGRLRHPMAFNTGFVEPCFDGIYTLLRRRKEIVDLFGCVVFAIAGRPGIRSEST